MKSVIEFDESQQEVFRLIVKDFGGPTSTKSILETLEYLVNNLAQPDIDPSWIDDEEHKLHYEVCMAALEYARMIEISGR